MRIDTEKDFHGYRGSEMLDWLEDVWSRRTWHGLRRVRLIHGSGAVLYRVARQWADEKGIPWATEPNNPGVTILHPSMRMRLQNLPARTQLTRETHRLEEDIKPTAARPPAQEPNLSGPSATEEDEIRALMEEEFNRLASEEPQQLARRKRG